MEGGDDVMKERPLCHEWNQIKASVTAASDSSLLISAKRDLGDKTVSSVCVPGSGPSSDTMSVSL